MALFLTILKVMKVLWEWIYKLKKEIEQNQIEIEKKIGKQPKFSRIHTEKVAKPRRSNKNIKL